MNDFIQQLFSPELGFLRCALLMGLFAAPALGCIGTMVVTRRISSLAGASAHAALGGVGIALYLQRVCGLMWCTASLGALFGAVWAALVVGIITMSAREREDTVIGVVWALGMSIGLLILDRTPGYVDWQGYLFGNILLIDQSALLWTLALDALILIPLYFGYNRLLAVSFDPVFAELRGVQVRGLYLGLLAVTAVTIVLLINVVGIILVIALLTLPAATAGCFTKHLWSTMALSTLLSWLFMTAGLFASFYCNLPSGPAIVVLAGAVYLAAQVIRRQQKR